MMYNYIMAKLVLDLHDIYNKGKQIDTELNRIIDDAVNKKIKLLYPYKKDSYNFRMWKKYYSGASGLMGLKIKSKNTNSVKKFVNSLKLFGYGYSWGGFESLALHQEYRETGNRKYLNLAKDEHLVRLHIGLEDPSDLIADIKQALKHLK